MFLKCYKTLGEGIAEIYFPELCFKLQTYARMAKYCNVLDYKLLLRLQHNSSEASYAEAEYFKNIALPDTIRTPVIQALIFKPNYFYVNRISHMLNLFLRGELSGQPSDVIFLVTLTNFQVADIVTFLNLNYENFLQRLEINLTRDPEYIIQAALLLNSSGFTDLEIR